MKPVLLLGFLLSLLAACQQSGPSPSTTEALQDLEETQPEPEE